MTYGNFASLAAKLWPAGSFKGPGLRWTLTEEEQKEAIYLALSVSGQDGQSQDYIEHYCNGSPKSNKQRAKDMLKKLETDEKVTDFLSSDCK